jgi:hypothetical protein
MRGVMSGMLVLLTLLVVFDCHTEAVAEEVSDRVVSLDEVQGLAPPAKAAAKAAAKGSGSGSGSGVSLSNLKKPYESNLSHNKHIWASNGGWTSTKEAMLAVAKAELKKAQQYAEKKEHEKKVAELGCPCVGEKYHDDVWNPKKPAAAAGSGSGSGSGSGKKKGCNPTDPTQNCDGDPKFGIKAMLKKYGKLGPNSSWTKMHENMKKEAHTELKVAEAQAHAAFMRALPEFKKMKEEMPEFFTNGKCKCPSWWTIPMAVSLAAKMTRDKEADYRAHFSVVFRQQREMSGEEAADKAAEEARMKAAAAKKPPAKAAAPKAPTIQDVLAKEFRAYAAVREREFEMAVTQLRD